jgi:hypothetical protein
VHAEFNLFGTLLSEMKLTLSIERRKATHAWRVQKTLFEMERGGRRRSRAAQKGREKKGAKKMGKL